MATSISGSAIDLELKEQIPSTSGWVLYVPRVLFTSIVYRESCTPKKPINSDKERKVQGAMWGPKKHY